MPQRRRALSRFSFDWDGLRRGVYTDKYFLNAARILERLAAEKYRFAGQPAREIPDRLAGAPIDTGNIHAELQFFTRREPFSMVAGMKPAVAILHNAAGYFTEKGRFVARGGTLDIDVLRDGVKARPWETVMRVRGRYRDFGALETPVLGVLSRSTRIATNVYLCLTAAPGKPLFFFPARFDLPETQRADGYAYKVAVDAYNAAHRKKVPLLVSTDAQGEWWGGTGGGTISHSYLLCFLKDTVEATLQFARVLPPETRRIALVDVNGDCIADSVAVVRAFFDRYRTLVDAGSRSEADKYVLFAVRPDTPAHVLDKGIDPGEAADEDYGVSSKLVRRLRRALNEAYTTMELPRGWLTRARKYCRSVKIIVSGGFTPEKVASFERDKVPVDMYGIGSYLFRGEKNDFTADVVAVKLRGRWTPLAKSSRARRPNRRLRSM